MSDKYEFTYFDWSKPEDNAALWTHGAWKDFNILLGNTALNFDIDFFFGEEGIPQNLLDKMINVCHCPYFNDPHFTEKVHYRDGPLFCGLTRDILTNFKDEYEIIAELAPVGVDISKFYPTRTINKIKKIGFIGKPMGSGHPEWENTKRPEMFQQICDKTNTEAVYIYGKPHTDYKDLYKDIDLLIYCSRFEGVATGICEAASCGIPVISTYVGNAKNIESIKTFETIDEACDIINSFNRHPAFLEKYISSLTEEVRKKWNWKHLCKKFWEPMLEKKLERGGDTPPHSILNTLKQTWWDENLPTMYGTFCEWVGDSKAESKIYFRNFLKENDFSTIIDIGCGPATEYEGFKQDGIEIEYIGVDSSEYLYGANTTRNIPMILADAHNIPVPDSSYEIAFSRHLLEHQPDFRPLLDEMVRVGSKLATHIFFIKPSDKENIDFNPDLNLYHNTYEKHTIEAHLRKNPKVVKVEWRDITDDGTEGRFAGENMILIWLEETRG